MRISDWSSDVCSSDLIGEDEGILESPPTIGVDRLGELIGDAEMVADLVGLGHGDELGGGRALAEPAFQSRVAGGFAEMHRALDQPPLALDRLESPRVEIGNEQRAQLEKFEERPEQIGIGAADL